VDLGEAFASPELAHRVLDRRLYLEDQPPVGPAQVEVAPVDPLVQGRIARDRQLGLRGGVDGQPIELQLQPAQLDPLVGDHGSRHGHRRLGGQARDLLVELRRRVLPAEHHLSLSRFVANHKELHALLIAHDLHPAADRHLLAYLLAQVGYARAGHWGDPIPRRPDRTATARTRGASV